MKEQREWRELLSEKQTRIKRRIADEDADAKRRTWESLMGEEQENLSGPDI